MLKLFTASEKLNYKSSILGLVKIALQQLHLPTSCHLDIFRLKCFVLVHKHGHFFKMLQYKGLKCKYYPIGAMKDALVLKSYF